MTTLTRTRRFSATCCLAAVLTGCGTSGTRVVGLPTPVQPALAKGAGGTYPDPIYQKWIERYLEANDHKMRIEYAATGSQRGIELVTSHRVDYGATDWPSDQDTDLVQFPTVAGAVVIIYRIDALKTDLRLAPETLGRILHGDIKRWNHPAILKDNPEANLPASEIVLVHRDDGSGTTRIICELAQAYNTSWQTGCDFKVTWPADSTGATGSAELANAVYGTNNTIGYVEYTFALQNKLQHALIRNKSGQFIRADSDSIAAAIPEFLPTTNARELARSILNTKVPSAYPISALTWMLVPPNATERARRALKPFFQWTMTPEAQAYVELLGYVQLTASLRDWEQAALSRIP
jgi:phosphate transport system substrate-binding protein